MAAPDGHADEGPPLTELESLQLKAKQIMDESLQSTSRMTTLDESSREAGVKIVELLQHKGKQLAKAVKGIANMNANMCIL